MSCLIDQLHISRRTESIARGLVSVKDNIFVYIPFFVMYVLYRMNEKDTVFCTHVIL